ADNVRTMVDELLQNIQKPELAWLAVDDRQHDDAEADLHLRLLIQVVEYNLGLFAALQLEDDAHAVPIALVADFRNAFQLLLVHKAGRMLDEARLVDLV